MTYILEITDKSTREIREDFSGRTIRRSAVTGDYDVLHFGDKLGCLDFEWRKLISEKVLFRVYYRDTVDSPYIYLGETSQSKVHRDRSVPIGEPAGFDEVMVVILTIPAENVSGEVMLVENGPNIISPEVRRREYRRAVYTHNDVPPPFSLAGETANTAKSEIKESVLRCVAADDPSEFIRILVSATMVDVFRYVSVLARTRAPKIVAKLAAQGYVCHAPAPVIIAAITGNTLFIQELVHSALVREVAFFAVLTTQNAKLISDFVEAVPPPYCKSMDDRVHVDPKNKMGMFSEEMNVRPMDAYATRCVGQHKWPVDIDGLRGYVCVGIPALGERLLNGARTFCLDA